VPTADEALIQVQLAGICATDLEMVKGYVPDFQGVLGHEFVGHVVECAQKEWIGRRVVGSINIGCGDCLVCQQDGPEHCSSRKAVGIHQQDGVFADSLVLPIANLFPVPDTVSNEAAVFTEPLAAAVRITKQIDVARFAKTAVVGPGRLGLLIGQVLAHAGTHVTMIGRSAESLILPQQFGLDTALTGDFAPNSFDLVVEATGNSAGFAHSLELIRPLGTLILKSTFSGSSNLNLTKIVVDEITVLGSRCGPFAPALQLLAQQAIQLSPMIDATYSLEDGLAAFSHAAQPNVRKVLIRP
jgi:threonine dehydrogenase-like Zn-dependent dehydrogenase